MQITQDSGEGNQITAYEVGRVTVNDTVLTHSLIITPVMLIHDWGVNSLHSLSTEPVSYTHLTLPTIYSV